MTEHQLQAAVVDWCKLNDIFVFAVPNEGRRSKALGARMKERGLVKGVPDLVMPYPRGGYGSLYLETKSKRGKLSPAQCKIHEVLELCGNMVVTYNQYDIAIEAIVEYLRGNYVRKLRTIVAR